MATAAQERREAEEAKVRAAVEREEAVRQAQIAAREREGARFATAGSVYCPEGLIH